MARKARPFLNSVGEIAKDDGYHLNARKTKIMQVAHRRQITGMVVNQHINVGREPFDALKARLTNCIRSGAEGPNRGSHLSRSFGLDHFQSVSI